MNRLGDYMYTNFVPPMIKSKIPPSLQARFIRHFKENGPREESIYGKHPTAQREAAMEADLRVMLGLKPGGSKSLDDVMNKARERLKIGLHVGLETLTTMYFYKLVDDAIAYVNHILNLMLSGKKLSDGELHKVMMTLPRNSVDNISYFRNYLDVPAIQGFCLLKNFAPEPLQTILLSKPIFNEPGTRGFYITNTAANVWKEIAASDPNEDLGYPTLPMLDESPEKFKELFGLQRNQRFTYAMVVTSLRRIFGDEAVDHYNPAIVDAWRERNSEDVTPGVINYIALIYFSFVVLTTVEKVNEYFRLRDQGRVDAGNTVRALYKVAQESRRHLPENVRSLIATKAAPEYVGDRHRELREASASTRGAAAGGRGRAKKPVTKGKKEKAK